MWVPTHQGLVPISAARPVQDLGGEDVLVRTFLALDVLVLSNLSTHRTCLASTELSKRSGKGKNKFPQNVIFSN